MVSHTGVKDTCDNQRNLSDDQLHRIARNGGLVGVVGIDHVALGSDYDGAVAVPFDVSGVVLVT